MGIRRVFKKLKMGYNKMMDMQAEAPYRLQKKLKKGWTNARKSSSAFNKFSKGVEAVKTIGKKAYKSKFSKSIGKGLNKLEKIPIVGGSVKDVRKLAKGVVKDPFAVKSNLLNLARVLPATRGANFAKAIVADKAKEKFLNKIDNPIARREERAKDRVFGKKNKQLHPPAHHKIKKPTHHNGGIRPPHMKVE